MQTTADPVLKLPDIRLSDLSERTKDFLISRSTSGKPVPDVIRELLNEAAAKHGFASKPANPAKAKNPAKAGR